MSLSVSVVVITRNRLEQLEVVIKSLTLQSDREFELVIVSASTDRKNEESRINAFRSSIKISYIYEPKRGYGLARNLGVVNSNGEIVAFIDDDCLAETDWIEKIKQSHARINKPNSVVMGLSVSGPEDNFWAQVAGLHYDNWRNSICSNGFCQTLDAKVTSFNKKIFTKQNIWFDEGVKIGSEDIEFGRRLSTSKIKISFDPEVRMAHIERLTFKEAIKQRWRIALGEYEVSLKVDNLEVVQMLPPQKLSRLKKRALEKLKFWLTKYHRVDWVVGYLICIPLFYLIRVGAYVFGPLILRTSHE